VARVLWPRWRRSPNIEHFALAESETETRRSPRTPIGRSSGAASYSCQETPSTPGAAFLVNEEKLSRSRSTVRWWSKAVNLISLFSRAAFRTPRQPL
jgi:hypothetical protein